jgi:hypothetical protein
VLCSCVVWDTGCRNRKTGAPRALWYGLEFIRFTLNRCWCRTDSSSSSSGSGGGSSDGSNGGGSSGQSPGGLLLRAHIRGHDVSRDFEAACRRWVGRLGGGVQIGRRFVCADTEKCIQTHIESVERGGQY